MKLYQVSFDATIIIVVAKNEKDVYKLLSSKDESFIKEGDFLFYKWKDDYVDKCNIIELLMNKSQVLHWESH